MISRMGKNWHSRICIGLNDRWQNRNLLRRFGFIGRRYLGVPAHVVNRTPLRRGRKYLPSHPAQCVEVSHLRVVASVGFVGR